MLRHEDLLGVGSDDIATLRGSLASNLHGDGTRHDALFWQGMATEVQATSVQAGAGVAVVACGRQAHMGTVVDAAMGVPGVTEPSRTGRRICLGVALIGVEIVVAMTVAGPRIGVWKPHVAVRALAGGERKPAARGD